MAQKPIANKGKVTMTTPLQQKLRDKMITAKKWAEMVKPGDWINRGGPGSDAVVTMEALAARLGGGPGDLNNIEIWNQAMMCGNGFCAAADMDAKYHVVHEAFLLATLRGLVTKGYKAMDWKQLGMVTGYGCRVRPFLQEGKDKTRNGLGRPGMRGTGGGLRECQLRREQFLHHRQILQEVRLRNP